MGCESIRTVIEESLEKVLSSKGVKIETIDGEMSFISMGLDSLNIADLVSLLNRGLGVSLGIETLFEYYCVDDLTEFLADGSIEVPS